MPESSSAEPSRPATQGLGTARELWFAVGVSLPLAVFASITHWAPSTYDMYDLGDSSYYLSMVGHRWMDPGMTGWTLRAVRLPFRYRILTPSLAGLLPFDPVLSLALVNYVSIAAAYVFLLLMCRRLGLSRHASALGLGVAFTFISPVSTVSVALNTDGFILLVLSAMAYAFVADSFWMFAAWGLVGTFAREAPVMLLPLWCVRDLKRGITVTAIAGIAMAALRVTLMEDSGPSWHVLHPSWLFAAAVQTVFKGPAGASYWPPRVTARCTGCPASPWYFVNGLKYCWGWAYVFTPIGLALLPRDALARIGPVALALGATGLTMSLVATDTCRQLMVLLPIVVVAAGQLTAELMVQKRRMFVALLVGLAAIQFLMSEPSLLVPPKTWAMLSVRVPIIKIGAFWTIGAAILLRRELAGRFRGSERSEDRSLPTSVGDRH